MALDAFERYQLLFGPRPIHPLDRLSAHLGGPPALNAHSGVFR